MYVRVVVVLLGRCRTQTFSGPITDGLDQWISDGTLARDRLTQWRHRKYVEVGTKNNWTRLTLIARVDLGAGRTLRDGTCRLKDISPLGIVYSKEF